MRARYVFFVLLLAVAGTHRLYAEAGFSFSATPGQLPKTAVPSSYSLTLQPDPDTLQFTGSETVALNLLAPEKELVLNQNGLSVSSALLVSDTSRQRFAPGILCSDSRQTLHLIFDRTLPAGSYHLRLAWKGKAGVAAQGLFYVRYRTAAGIKRVMFATEMEPSDARRMFPCWDEPSFKATFQVNAVVPEPYRAVSNMPVSSRISAAGGLQRVSFAPTPRMSTYLVVLVTGLLDSLAGEADGIPVHVFTTEGKTPRAAYALSVMKDILPYYDRYYGVKYPLPKIDLIALPGGFPGAMENWGGIVYEEGAVLYNPATDSDARKEEVFNTISHETAHQWTGDLVTMAWWNDLWLNEGFANWMADKATAMFNPEWNVDQEHGTEENDTMEQDSYSAGHAIEQTITDPLQADSAFDDITYDKGEDVIRMIESFMGAGSFQKGMQKYIAAHEYSNATTADLWRALTEAGSPQMQAIGSSFTEQPGVPLVIVKRQADGAMRLTQQRFILDQRPDRSSSWRIPIACELVSAAGAARGRTVVLGRNPLEISAAAGSVVKLNAGGAGYYRVLYDDETFRQLALRSGALPVEDRINLLGDSWALAKAGMLPYSRYFTLAAARSDDPGLAEHDQLAGAIDTIRTWERGLPDRSRIESYIRSIDRPKFDRLGWTPAADESSQTRLLRLQLIRALANAGDPDIIGGARKRFADYLQDPASLPAPLIDTVLAIVGRYADQSTYDQLHRLALSSADYQTRRRYYGVLGDALDPALAHQTLDLILSPETADLPGIPEHILYSVASSGEHPDLACDFLKAHIDRLRRQLDPLTFSGLAPSLYAYFSDTDRADDLLAFAHAQLAPEYAPQVNTVVEQIRISAAEKARALPQIHAWLLSQNLPAPTDAPAPS